MKQTPTLHKALSMLLTAAMVMNIGLTPVFAQGVTPLGISSVCIHHTEHKEDCGYKQGAPCTHEHSEDCSTKELTCVLTEGDAPEIATDIIEENREDAVTAFAPAQTAYEALSPEDKTAFEATKQYKKLMALHTALYPRVLMTNSPVTLDISGADKYVYITATGYKVGTAVTETAHTGDYIITGTATSTNASGNHVMVSGGTHNITLKDASIQLSDTDIAAFSVEGNSTVNLTLEGTNVLKSGARTAGLQVTTGNVLTITNASTGSLSATGGQYGAGIGGGSNSAGGSITVSGGTVTATGGQYGAGIGGGNESAGGTITISGGRVTATGGDLGAGIGGGDSGAGGIITVSGGRVTATGGEYGAGIGGGYNGAGGTVKIDGNTVVYAQKGTAAPNHIGGGDSGASGTVTKAQGIIFEGERGKVYGDSVTLGADTTIPAGKTLTIDNGTSFLISPNTTLTNNGTLNGTGFVSLLRASSRVDGSGAGNTTHVKKLLAEDTTTIANTSYGTPPAVTWDGVALTANTDYTASGITAGASVPVTVTGVGDYHGSVTKNIAVTGGGGGGGGGGSTPTPPVTPEIPTTPTTAESNVNSKIDKDGNATATVADKDITNAIDKAQKEAKKNGTEKNGIAITLNVKTDKNATTLGVTLTQKSIAELIAAKVTQVTVNNGLSTITLDLATLNALKGGDVVLTVTKMDVKTLSAEAQNAIAGRPVFRFGATVGGKAVTDFKGGRVGLQMPYTRSTAEQVGNLCAVYIATGGADGNGKLTWLENSSYDPITGMMLASTSHFSIYGVGYKQSTPKFTDVGTHWAKNDIDFVVARGLLNGINAGGTSDTTFSPDAAISRQEMAVMLVNYSKTISYKLPSVHAQVTFTDAGSIASWAKDAVGQMQMAGILMGKSGNRFDPTATATRAEVSAMLRRYVELVISSDTAEGWAMNESGQWMYIQDGKRVTGSKTVDGKSYEFDQYGVTTALPPERKYLTYTVQKGESFWGIAWKYKVSMFELAKVNGKTIFSIIYTGDELKIPQQ